MAIFNSYVSLPEGRLSSSDHHYISHLKTVTSSLTSDICQVSISDILSNKFSLFSGVTFCLIFCLINMQKHILSDTHHLAFWHLNKRPSDLAREILTPSGSFSTREQLRQLVLFLGKIRKHGDICAMVET